MTSSGWATKFKGCLQRHLVPSAASILIILLYLPTLIWLVRSWLHNPYYSHGFLIPLVSAIIAWSKRGELKETRLNNAGVVVLAFGAGLYILGFVRDLRYVSAISLIVVLFGLVLSLYGTRVARSMAFAIGFLIFMIPMPFVGDVAFDLQRLSIHSSGWLLRVSGMPITVTGNLIILEDSTFSVGLPCSGLNTLIALMAFTALYAYLLAGSSSKRVLLFLCSVPVALLANILRIASIVVVAHFYDKDFAAGFYHDVSSLLFFLMALLCIALIGKILGIRFALRISRS